MCWLVLNLLALAQLALIQVAGAASRERAVLDDLVSSHVNLRNDMLAAAAAALKSKGGSATPLRHRKPIRAAADSTFGRFLSGHSAPYTIPPSSTSPFALRTADHEIRVVDFGADPTGQTSSDSAFASAISALLKVCNSTQTHMADGIADCGDAVVQLSGGAYRLDSPVSVPGFYGNFKFTSGTLRASAVFPAGRWLLEVGIDNGQCKQLNKQKSCNENIGVEDIMFDGAKVAHGGLLINATMGANAGPDLFFINFNHSGITVNGGHEVMLHQAWFGNGYYSQHQLERDGSIAIEYYGNDHIVSDVIVFNAQTGLMNTGGANLIEGLHCWNDATGLGDRKSVV